MSGSFSHGWEISHSSYKYARKSTTSRSSRLMSFFAMSLAFSDAALYWFKYRLKDLTPMLQPSVIKSAIVLSESFIASCTLVFIQDMPFAIGFGSFVVLFECFLGVPQVSIFLWVSCLDRAARPKKIILIFFVAQHSTTLSAGLAGRPAGPSGASRLPDDRLWHSLFFIRHNRIQGSCCAFCTNAHLIAFQVLTLFCKCVKMHNSNN